MLESLFNWIRDEWDTVRRAPFIMLLIALFGGFVGFTISDELYSHEIADLQADAALLKDRAASGVKITQFQVSIPRAQPRTMGQRLREDWPLTVPALFIGFALHGVQRRVRRAYGKSVRAKPIEAPQHDLRVSEPLTLEAPALANPPAYNWLPPTVAFERLGDPKHFDEFITAVRAESANSDRLAALQNQYLDAAENPILHDTLYRTIQAAQAEGRMLNARSTAKQEIMLRVFKLLLRHGAVIARGIRAPYVPGTKPQEIDAVDWAFLEFDAGDAVADIGFEAAHAGGVTYKGLEFRAGHKKPS